MHEYPDKYVPFGDVKPMKHPFQLRVEGHAYHYTDYSTALEEFHALTDDEPGTQVTLFQLGYYAPDRPEWWLISIGNIKETSRPVWTNLFAGYTLSRLFFLRNADRRTLARLHWPAPPNAVSWKYAPEVPPLEQQVAEALEPGFAPYMASVDEVEEPEPEVAPEEIDFAKVAASPGCRVDEATLRRRMAMGWDLDRAMTTPLLGTSLGEESWVKVNGKWRHVPGTPSTRS
jgi:hypothetical protein